MNRISEKRDVQDRLINYLIGGGWQFIPPGDFKRNHWRGPDPRQPFLLDTLRAQLAALNRWPAADPRLDRVIRQLHLLPANIEGNEGFVRWLRGQQTAYDPDQQREFDVTLIDYEDPGRNAFHFTEEMPCHDREQRRLDLVLFVNGLPVLLVENKNPKNRDPGWEGFTQVQETYTRGIPEFLKYPIPFAVPATRLEYGATWNPRPNAFYRWKTPEGSDAGLERLSKSFFAPPQVLSFLRDYTIFNRTDDAIQKLLLRPHQIRTVEKIRDRVLAGLATTDAPDTGLIWHTQGSGKTLTMIVAAQLLRRHPDLQNPTIIMVVDRIELESQMVANLEAFGYRNVHNPGRIQDLRRLLQQGTQGLIVTTIHKFDGMPADLMPNRNVVLMIDEAHRSQEGDLGIYLNAALPKAFRFGFTGTPIDRGKVGRGTFRLFGGYDPPGLSG